MRNQFILLAICLLFLSCDKLPESYNGKNTDPDLIGTWARSYSSRDSYNGITLFTDTIRFGVNNQGLNIIYAFDRIENKYLFQYYSEDNIVYIRPDGMDKPNPQTFRVQNDSLSIFGGPHYLKVVSTD